MPLLCDIFKRGQNGKPRVARWLLTLTSRWNICPREYTYHDWTGSAASYTTVFVAFTAQLPVAVLRTADVHLKCALERREESALSSRHLFFVVTDGLRMARRSWKRILVLGLGLIFVSHLILTLWTAQTFPDEAGDDYGGTLPPSALYHLLSPFNVSEDILELRKTISKINGDALVFNEDLFGGSAISPETVLFVIQVHNRGTYLRALIESLKEVRGITDALLVFSHDRYSDEINQIVRNVSFTRYMQIFYPYSVQLYPKAFAGKGKKG